MATSKVVYESKRVMLNLSEIEAMYLRNVLQNCPAVNSYPSSESEIDEESRSAIWCELNNCLETK